MRVIKHNAVFCSLSKLLAAASCSLRSASISKDDAEDRIYKKESFDGLTLLLWSDCPNFDLIFWRFSKRCIAPGKELILCRYNLLNAI